MNEGNTSNVYGSQGSAPGGVRKQQNPGQHPHPGQKGAPPEPSVFEMAYKKGNNMNGAGPGSNRMSGADYKDYKR